jgi:hypothetical protein
MAMLSKPEHSRGHIDYLFKLEGQIHVVVFSKRGAVPASASIDAYGHFITLLK